jgi:TM2 domain-containing membrane protein YozV
MAPGFRSDKTVSRRSRLAALLLCFFLGVFGVHRFYVGKVGTGVAMIFTAGGLGIWVLIDFIMIIVGGFTDIDGKFVLDWQV